MNFKSRQYRIPEWSTEPVSPTPPTSGRVHPQRARRIPILNPTQSRIPPTRGRVHPQRARRIPILNPTQSRTPPTRGRVHPQRARRIPILNPIQSRTPPTRGRVTIPRIGELLADLPLLAAQNSVRRGACRPFVAPNGHSMNNFDRFSGNVAQQHSASSSTLWRLRC